MANIKVSDLPAASSIDSGDLLLVSADPGGAATSKKITFAALISSIAALGALVLSGLNVTGQTNLQDLAFRNATGTNAAVGQITATTVNAGTENVGVLNVSGQSTLGNTTMTNATGTNVTTTNLAFTNGAGQALTVGGSPVCRAMVRTVRVEAESQHFNRSSLRERVRLRRQHSLEGIFQPAPPSRVRCAPSPQHQRIFSQTLERLELSPVTTSQSAEERSTQRLSEVLRRPLARSQRSARPDSHLLQT